MSSPGSLWIPGIFLCDWVTVNSAWVWYDRVNTHVPRDVGEWEERNMTVQSRKRKKAAVDQGHCVACGCCVKVCPRGAISVAYGCYAQVDESACVGCGLCAKACPADVIEMKEEEG